jgi:DNA-binding NtrC family response regulator
MSEGPLISEKVISQQLGQQAIQVDATAYVQQPIMPSHAEQQQNVQGTISTSPTSLSSIATLADVEKNAIEQAIELCQDNIVKAASLLGVSPSTLYRKIQQWQISPVE